MKLNLCCGPFQIPGYVNIDLMPFGQEVVRDIRRGLPYADNTIDEVNFSHALEHFQGEDMLFIVSECYRVLKPNGIWRVATPRGVESLSPMHLSYWNSESFKLFDRRNNHWQIPRGFDWDFRVENIFNSSVGLEVVMRAWKVGCVVNPQAAQVALICVAYGGLEHTKKFVTSIRRTVATVRSPEAQGQLTFILVDNSVDDETDAWAQGQADIVYRRSGLNLGWVGGLNYGLEQMKLLEEDLPPVRFEFVIVANNDVVAIEPGWLPRLLAHFTDESIGAVGPTSNYVAGRQNLIFRHEGIWEEPASTLIGFFMCIRRPALDQVGEFDDLHSYQVGTAHVSGGDDHDYCIRLKRAGWNLKIARDVFMFHTGSQALRKELSDRDYLKLCEDADQTLTAKWGKEETDRIFKPPLKVFLALPLRNDHPHKLFSLNLLRLVKPFLWEACDCPRAHTAVARNALVRTAIQSECTHVLFLDDDHVIPPDLFLRLYALDTPVASALAFMRQPPYTPCIYRWVSEPTQANMAVLPLGRDEILIGPRRVDATGFGAVLINTDVFRIIKDPWFEWAGENRLGEDLDFCLKCRDAGIEIWCDTNLVIPHIGDEQVIDEKVYLHYVPEPKLEETAVIEYAGK